MSESVDTPGINVTPPESQGFPLTKEFLELTFDKKIDTFTAKLGTNPGDNYLSIIHAVEVVFKGDSETRHYLIKCYPTHPSRREFLDQTDVFAKELFIYEDFLVQLKQIVIDSGAESVAEISSPPFHGGNIKGRKGSKYKDEPWCSENFVIMTDLRTKGYMMADRIKGLDVEHANLVLNQIGRLHAVSWAYKQKHGLQLLTSKYPTLTDTMYSNDELNEQFKSMMDNLTNSTLTMVKDEFGSDHPAYFSLKKILEEDSIQYFKHCFNPNGIDEDLMEGYLRVIPENDNNYKKDAVWLVGSHGDTWLNNVLFKYSEKSVPGHQKTPTDVTLLDFQIFRESCPTIDLAYFLFSSVRAPIRNPRINEFLKVYFDTFVQCCKALKVDLPPGFTFHNLKRRYRRAQIFGLLVALPLLSAILTPVGESKDLDEIEANDMGELFSSVMEATQSNSLYKDEVIATILNMYEEEIL